MDVGSPSLDGASDTQSCGDASPAHSSVVANSPSPPYIKPEPASCAMDTLTKECSDVVLPEGMVHFGACTKKRRLHDESAVPRVVPSSMLFTLEPLVEQVPLHQAVGGRDAAYEEDAGGRCVYPPDAAYTVFALPSASVALAHAQHTTTPAVPLVEASCTASDAVDELLAVGVGVDHADELKKLRRLVKNRESARNSRSRRKAYVEELEQKISVLTAEKAAMHEQLVSMYNENTILRAKLGEPVHVAVAIGTADEPALAMLDALPAASAVGQTVRETIAQAHAAAVASPVRAGTAVLLGALLMIGLVAHAPLAPIGSVGSVTSSFGLAALGLDVHTLVPRASAWHSASTAAVAAGASWTGALPMALGSTKGAVLGALATVGERQAAAQGRVLLSVEGDAAELDYSSTFTAGVHPPLDRKQLFVIALLEHFCKSVDVHAEGSLFVALCRRLLSLGFFDSLSFLDDMDALHRQYEAEFGVSAVPADGPTATVRLRSEPPPHPHPPAPALPLKQRAIGLPQLLGAPEEADQGPEQDALAPHSFFSAARPALPTMLCPKARLVHIPTDFSVLPAADADADGAGGADRRGRDSKALISFVVPKSSFRPLTHSAAADGEADGEEDGSMEVQCRDVRVRELGARFRDVDAMYSNLAAIDRLLHAGSVAASAAA